MKITDLGTAQRGIHGTQLVEHEVQASTDVSFSRQLTKLNRDQYHQQIAGLMEDIQRQGELVAKRADIKEMQKYRNMITDLLHQTVSNSYDYQKTNSFDARGRHRTYAMIRKVDSKLDEMTQEILGGQADQISLMSRVDDIRGLLVDIVF